MVDIPLKLIGEQVSVTTATTLNNSGLFRVYAPADVLVTIRSSANSVVGTMTMPAGAYEIITKDFDETVGANTALLCTPLAWR
jgi:hypothetical protein